MIRHWAAVIACALALTCVPFSVVAVSAAAVCDDTQPDCENTSCTSDDCDPPPPAPVVVPRPGDHVNACINLGGRRRVSVNGCI